MAPVDPDIFFFVLADIFFLGKLEIVSSNVWTFRLSFLSLFGLGDRFTNPTYDFHVQMPTAPSIFLVQFSPLKDFESLLCRSNCSQDKAHFGWFNLKGTPSLRTSRWPGPSEVELKAAVGITG